MWHSYVKYAEWVSETGDDADDNDDDDVDVDNVATVNAADDDWWLRVWLVDPLKLIETWYQTIL